MLHALAFGSQVQKTKSCVKQDPYARGRAFLGPDKLTALCSGWLLQAWPKVAPPHLGDPRGRDHHPSSNTLRLLACCEFCPLRRCDPPNGCADRPSLNRWTVPPSYISSSACAVEPVYCDCHVLAGPAGCACGENDDVGRLPASCQALDPRQKKKFGAFLCSPSLSPRPASAVQSGPPLETAQVRAAVPAAIGSRQPLTTTRDTCTCRNPSWHLDGHLSPHFLRRRLSGGIVRRTWSSSLNRIAELAGPAEPGNPAGLLAVGLGSSATRR